MPRDVRALVVDGQEFTWRVIQNAATCVVRVWALPETRTTWAEFELPRADPWLDVSLSPTAPITPGTVADLIRSKLRAH